MIKKFSFGNIIETDATVIDIETTKGDISFFEIQDDALSYKLGEEDIVYGLGENIRGINKRGYKYISDCTDQPCHTEDRHSLYGAHNFLIVDGKKRFGVFIDTPAKVEFDIDYTRINELKISVEDNNYNLYIIEADSCLEITKEFRRLIGRSYIPPKWAFGYGQSRWGYFSAQEVRDLVKDYKEKGIPVDSVYLDICYMKDYKDFTIDKEAFPEFESFVKEMEEQEIHLVPIIDAGVKIEDGYETYEEGLEKGYFCKDKNGKELICGVWPGDVYFPDFLNKDAREWFGNKYKFLLDMGIDGFWNDMNEPAIFYTRENLNEVFKGIEEYKTKDMNVDNFFAFKDLVTNLPNNEEDYKRLYHNIDGKKVRHDKVHNLYGYNMTRAASEAFDKLEPEKRILMFSRASYIGAHRFGGIWQGDNCSWWSHVKLSIQMSPSLNMCGFLFNGPDVGGFGSNCTEELMFRWLEFGIFTPLMRNHSAIGTRRQEIHTFEKEEQLKDIIELRYCLLPYIYSEYMKSVLNDDMYIKPLAFEYENDSMAKKVEDQLLVGDSIMIAPVYEQNAKGRYVYLPETMKMLKISSKNSIKESIVEKGHHYIDIAMNELLIFIKPGKSIPFSTGGKKISDIDYSNLKYYEYESIKKYDLYNDDGISRIL